MSYAIYEAVSYKLLNDPTVSGIVGENVWNGWRPIEDNDLPCISHYEVGATKLPQGVSTFASLRVSCWHNNYKGARQLAEAVNACLNNFAGEVGGLQIDLIKHQDKVELFEPTTNIIHIVQIFSLVYQADNEIIYS